MAMMTKEEVISAIQKCKSVRVCVHFAKDDALLWYFDVTKREAMRVANTSHDTSLAASLLGGILYIGQ